MRLLEAESVRSGEQSRVAEGAREMGDDVDEGFAVGRMQCGNDDRVALTYDRQITQF